MSLKETDLDEFNFIVFNTLEQFYDDRLFEIYNLNNFMSNEKMSFFEYKEKLEKMSSKEIDVDKVKKDTNKALSSFINSLKKEGENNE